MRKIKTPTLAKFGDSECEELTYKKQPFKRSFSYTHFNKKVR
nr:MAG TPA: hypothetical protein [Caudoviricetes sp.]DAY41268.1 MAG TPA: hypothetical protein [Caudoviricetes sp.]